MQEWIRQAFESPEFGVSLLPAALLLGVLTAVGSGCNVAMIAAVAGYSASRTGRRRGDVLLSCACFMMATVVSLATLGALVGYFGELAADSLGLYGTLLAGMVTVFFGLLTLGLAPLRLPSLDSPLKKGTGSEPNGPGAGETTAPRGACTLSQRPVKPAVSSQPRGLLGAAVFGLVVGGASATCTMVCCGPLLPAVLSAAALRGQGGWGALILTCFAVGYTAPLTATMLGLGLGRLTRIAARLAGPVRAVAGLLLVGAGFWLLVTA